MAACLFFQRANAQQRHPNFSGLWVRASRTCEPPESAGGSYQMDIRDEGPQLNITIQAEQGGVTRQLPLAYKPGQFLHYTGLDGDDFRSKPSWRDSTLVFDATELEHGKTILSSETFSLTSDGTKLITRKKEDGPGEHSVCTSVFERSSRASNELSPVRITLQKDRIAIDIGGQPFTNLYMGVEANKPFLYPLRTASGKKVTRGFPLEPQPGDPTDRPHQKGLWIGAEELSDQKSGRMDLWENDSSYHDRPDLGRIVFKDVLNTEMKADRGSFTMLSNWVSRQGESVLAETRKMTFYATPADCRMFDVDLTLKATVDLTFHDHHDSVIGMRLGPAFDEKNGGRPLNAQGLEGEANVRGKRSEWIDWQAVVNGEKVGVALMDHPSNFSWPTRWHVRSNGVLIASPFGQKDFDPAFPLITTLLRNGEELHLRYRVLIHPLSTDVGSVYRKFAAE